MRHKIFEKYPVIILGRVTLNELSVNDAEDFLEYLSNKNVNKYLSADDIPKNIVQAREELAYWSKLFYYKQSLYWGIYCNQTKKLIGTLGFNSWSLVHKRVEVSYDLNYNYWGQGIMKEALSAINNFAFMQMEVNRVQATVATDNNRSIKLLENLGFENEGVLRQYAILHDQIKDYYMYSLVIGK